MSETYPRMLSVREAAAQLGVSKSWLDKKRVDGGGPLYSKIGARVVYSPADIVDFAAQAKRRHTSENV